MGYQPELELFIGSQYFDKLKITTTRLVKIHPIKGDPGYTPPIIGNSGPPEELLAVEEHNLNH